MAWCSTVSLGIVHVADFAATLLDCLLPTVSLLFQFTLTPCFQCMLFVRVNSVHHSMCYSAQVYTRAAPKAIHWHIHITASLGMSPQACADLSTTMHTPNFSNHLFAGSC